MTSRYISCTPKKSGMKALHMRRKRYPIWDNVSRCFCRGRIDPGGSATARIRTCTLIRLDREMETRHHPNSSNNLHLLKGGQSRKALTVLFIQLYIELLSNEATQCLAWKRFYLRCLWMSALALKNLLGGSTGDQEKLLQFCFPR